MEVILYQPLIPQNTGNIARSCLLMGASLTLVRPLGFSLSEKSLRRAGMDYWNQLEYNVISNLTEYLEQTEKPFFFFSSRGKAFIHEEEMSENHILIFGNEEKGLPEDYHKRWGHLFLKIPMPSGLGRCFNLSNAVAITLYEANRPG
jgi:tRNA (cytidine/uridine-2'-O-)-methyltransferase